jgi:hypothetical protein
MIDSAKAAVDIMLGVLAITNGTRTLDGYVADMKARGQSDKRIEEVRKSLADLSELSSTDVVDTASIPKTGKLATNRKGASVRI